jgi:hypothetical protein
VTQTAPIVQPVPQAFAPGPGVAPVTEVTTPLTEVATVAAGVVAADAGVGTAVEAAGVLGGVTEVIPVKAPRGRRKRRKPRKARLRIAKLDPWSVMKTSFLFSIAFGIITFVAVWASWNVIETSGLFESLNESVSAIVTSSNDATPWRIQDHISGDQVIGAAALISAVNVILLTALGTLVAFLYNLASNVIGGLEVTLSDR